ncbi:hypothetical protein TorRG33x02_350870, partial [Trema orientale]
NSRSIYLSSLPNLSWSFVVVVFIIIIILLLLVMMMIIVILLMHFSIMSKRVKFIRHPKLEQSFSSVFHRKRLARQIIIKIFSSVFPRIGLQAHTLVGLAVHRKGLAVVAKKVVHAETLR